MRDTLREQQYALARHVRDPDRHAPPPGIERRRARVYRELFFNSIEGLLSSGFPVIRETLGDTRWKQLVRAFFARHRSRTPLFPRVASEFVDYVASAGDVPDWLPELAHYEWIEQLLYTSDAMVPVHDDGDVLDSILGLSPLAMPLAYRWPVTDIGPANVPKHAPAEVTTLLAHRDPAHTVHFARITPIVHRLLVAIGSTQATGRAHLSALAKELSADIDEIQMQGTPLLETLQSQGVVLANQR